MKAIFATALSVACLISTGDVHADPFARSGPTVAPVSSEHPQRIGSPYRRDNVQIMMDLQENMQKEHQRSQFYSGVQRSMNDTTKSMIGKLN